MSRVPKRGMLAIVVAVGLLALDLAGPGGLAAQATGTVRGTVTEQGTARPLPGVQVSIEGTMRGGLTDADGAYVISGVPVGAVTVRVESIGYRRDTQSVTVTDGQTAVANFTLQLSAVGLDEIVVTGTAGRTTKRAIGNSVSTVNAAAITDAAPIANVQQLLQGRSPGVTMLANTGVVGGSSKLKIRGASSLTAGNEPVVYVDGVRIQSGTQRTSGTTAQGINMLESINPSDIE